MVHRAFGEDIIKLLGVRAVFFFRELIFFDRELIRLGWAFAHDQPQLIQVISLELIGTAKASHNSDENAE